MNKSPTGLPLRAILALLALLVLVLVLPVSANSVSDRSAGIRKTKVSSRVLPLGCFTLGPAIRQVLAALSLSRPVIERPWTGLMTHLPPPENFGCQWIEVLKSRSPPMAQVQDKSALLKKENLRPFFFSHLENSRCPKQA